MREYKFRGKGIADDEWYYGDLIQSHLGTAWIITENYTTVIEDISLNTCASPQVDTETVGQYTGLKDKNGKEIYEGDIVQQGKIIYEIIYSDADASFIQYSKEYHYTTKINNNDLEVIGNIYDNKSLLDK